MVKMTNSDRLSPESYHFRCLYCHVILHLEQNQEVEGSPSSEAAEMQNPRDRSCCRGRRTCLVMLGTVRVL